MPRNEPTFHINIDHTRAPINFGKLSLVQIGRRYCSPGETIAPHTHESWFEVTVVLGGEADVRTNDSEIKLCAGDIHLAFPYEIHAIRAGENSGFEYDFFAFIPHDTSLSESLEEVMQVILASGSRISKDESIPFLIRNAINEYSVKSDAEVLKNTFELIITYLVRAFKKNVAERIPSSKSEVMCYKIMNYIDTHVYSIKNTSEIAEVFSYNYNYLSDLFKKTTGKTIFDYYSSRKLELGRIMVLEKGKKICEIAELLNYSSAFAFTKAFKAKYGISPKRMQAASSG